MAIKSADQITIVDITDAYSVILTSEAYTFVGGTSGATSGSCSTQAVAYCGSNQCSNVSVNQSSIVCPSGISASVSNSGSSSVTITFTIKSGSTISTACEATIPVVVTNNGDTITVNKKFSFAVAKTGQNGEKGDKGDKGDQGDQGIQGIQGVQGEKGDAAITVVITSSDGVIFKNSSGSTTLTAHVYVGGVEQTVDSNGKCGNYGYVKWYEGASTTAAATAKTYTVAASKVASTLSVTAKLEG